MSLDDALLQLAGIFRLHAPLKNQLQFLQEWIDGETEGAMFLRNRELNTWGRGPFDYVSLMPKQEEGKLRPYFVNFYHRLRGGHRKV